jgi:hypothetical protein
VGDAIVNELGGPLRGTELNTGRVIGKIGDVEIKLGANQAAISRQHSALMNTIVPETRSTLNQEKQQRLGIDQARQNTARLAQESLKEQRIGERTVTTQAQTKAAVDASKARLAAEQAATRRETTRGLNATAAAARSAAAAIKAKKLSTTVRVVNNLRLTVRDTQQKLTFQQNAALYG